MSAEMGWEGVGKWEKEEMEKCRRKDRKRDEEKDRVEVF